MPGVFGEQTSSIPWRVACGGVKERKVSIRALFFFCPNTWKGDFPSTETRRLQVEQVLGGRY